MKMWQCQIDDPRITEMDPVRKAWMQQMWLADHEEKAELAKNQAYLIASFDHPEEVQKMLGKGDQYISTEEEFDESSRMVRDFNLKALETQNSSKKSKRKRKMKLNTK